MKLWSVIFVFINLSLIFLAGAASLLPPTEKEAVSQDGAYRAVVTPPHFEDATSYEFFQEQNFLGVGAVEGENRARTSSVQIAVYRLSDGKSQLVWARPAPSTVIPKRVFLVGTNRVPLLVIEGRYGQTSQTLIPFSAFTSDGVCLTNGNFEILKTNDHSASPLPWTYDGNNLTRLATDGSIAITLKIPQSKSLPK